jgi:Spy/CpxP family protein refolding chaperone
MMKIHARYFVAAMLAAAPATVAAQTPAPAQAGEHHGAHGQMHGRRGPGGPGAHSPIQGILGQRQQLGLSAEQVSRLDAIDRDLQARNAPLHQQLQALMPEDLRAAAHRDGPPAQGERRQPPQGGQAQGGGHHGQGDHPQLTAEQRQRMERIHEQARPLMEQVHQNFEAAMEQVHTVLTPEQQQRARQGMERHGGPGHHGAGGEHGRHGDRPRQGGRAPR